MPCERSSNPAALFLLRDVKSFFILNKNTFFFSKVTTFEKYSKSFITFHFDVDKNSLNTRGLVGKTSLTSPKLFRI